MTFWSSAEKWPVLALCNRFTWLDVRWKRHTFVHSSPTMDHKAKRNITGSKHELTENWEQMELYKTAEPDRNLFEFLNSKATLNMLRTLFSFFFSWDSVLCWIDCFVCFACVTIATNVTRLLLRYLLISRLCEVTWVTRLYIDAQNNNVRSLCLEYLIIIIFFFCRNNGQRIKI